MATTLLEAVNALLATIGEAPTQSVDNSGSVSVAVAVSAINESSRQIQSRGCYFNTDEGYSLIPDISGEITLPPNTLFVDASDTTLNVVQRGTRLYNRDTHSYEFETAVEVDLVILLPFEEMPEYARYLSVVIASRRFQTSVLGAPGVLRYSPEDEQRAWIAFEQAEAEQADYNLSDGFTSTLVERYSNRRL